MDTSKLTKIVKNVQVAAKKHSPEILTGLGIAGLVTTTIMAVKATPKALRLIEIAEDHRFDESDPEFTWSPLSKIETVKTVWRCYLPATIVGTISIGCLIGASSVNARRNAALATAYALSESTLKEYQEKVVEKIGEKKEQEIRDDIAKDHVDRNPISKKEVIVTGNGDTTCYDVISGRYFMSSIEKLRRAENDLNRQMRYDMYISLNEFYDAIGLDHIKIGDDLGWNIDAGYIELKFSSQLDEHGMPCLVLDYTLAPKYGYQQ